MNKCYPIVSDVKGPLFIELLDEATYQNIRDEIRRPVREPAKNPLITDSPLYASSAGSGGGAPPPPDKEIGFLKFEHSVHGHSLHSSHHKDDDDDDDDENKTIPAHGQAPEKSR